MFAANRPPICLGSCFLALALTLPLMAGEPAGAQAHEQEYRVGPEDGIVIQIVDSGDPDIKATITPGGYILMPHLGRVRISGMTPSEIEKFLVARLADGYFVHPKVVVSVTDYKSKKVLVFGAAAHPGTVPIIYPITLVELLSKVGGQGSGSDGRITLIRGGPDGRKLKTFDIKKILAGEAESSFELKPDDIVLFTGTKSGQYYMMGEVRRQGVYPLHKDMIVRQALLYAGGLTRTGSERKILFLRVIDGKETRIKAKVTDKVLDGDTIIVKEGWF